MEFINDGTALVIQDKNFEYRFVLDKLINKGASEIASVLEKNNIFIPRVLNVSALRDILNLRIPKAKVLDLSDEMLYRLREYEHFSEFQLQNLFLEICNNKDDLCKYLLAFYDKIINNAGLLGMSDDVLIQLLILDDKENDFAEFEKELFRVSRDFRGFFDGVQIDELREALPNSATTQELRELGSKYGIEIPKRLRRNEIEAYVSNELKKQGKLDAELKERLAKMPIMTLQRLAKNNGIRISADLKKEDVINYLLDDAQKYPIKPMKKVNLVGLESDFVFDLAYVDTTEDNKSYNTDSVEDAPAKEYDSLKESTAILKKIINDASYVRETPREVRDVTIDNRETNDLLKSLIEEVKESNSKALPNALVPLFDDEAKGLLRELISEIKKSNEREIKVSLPSSEAPQVTVLNQVDTKAIVDSIDSLVKTYNQNSSRIIDEVRVLPEAKDLPNAEEDKPTAAIEELALAEAKEELPKDNFYPFDNFTDQVNPYYDSVTATKLLGDSNADLVIGKATPTKLEKKEEKLQSKHEAKLEKEKNAKLEKETRLQEKLLEKQAKVDNKKLRKTSKKAAKEAAKRQRMMEEKLKSGKIYDVDKDEFNNYMRVKEFDEMQKRNKREKHRDRMSKVGTIFKTIFLIIILLAIVWLVFALLFSFDQALGIRDWFNSIGMNWLFDGPVEAFKNMFGSGQ